MLCLQSAVPKIQWDSNPTALTAIRLWPGRVAQSVGHLTRKVRGPGFDTRSGNILSFLLPLFPEGQLSVTGESMCTKFWLTA